MPTLTPPKTVHVAIVVGSLNGTLGLSLPCPEKTQNLSAGCERRRRLLTALSSFAELPKSIWRLNFYRWDRGFDSEDLSLAGRTRLARSVQKIVNHCGIHSDISTRFAT